jgi:hypothetical protein
MRMEKLFDLSEKAGKKLCENCSFEDNEFDDDPCYNCDIKPSKFKQK